MFRQNRIWGRRPMTPTRPFQRHGAPVVQGVGLGLAIALGASALVSREMAVVARQTHPARGRFRRIGDVTLNYVDEGQGPVVVLIHGNGTMWNDWVLSGVVKELAKSHRVIAVSRPGFGYSTRARGAVWTASRQGAVISGLLDGLGIAQATVVGHSWGTLVALAMALDRPQRVSGLVLLSGYFYPSARPDVPLLSPTSIPVLGDVLR